MGEIYSGATGIVVWLGNDKEISALLGAVSGLSIVMKKSGVRLNRKKFDQTEGEMVDVLMNAPGACVQGLVSLTTNIYWRRQWIVQEFILAEQVTFLCGSSSAEFEAVRDAVHLIETNIDRLKLFAGKIQRLSHTMEDEEKVNTAFRRVLNARERHPRQMGKEKLQRLLIEFKESECYDVRDRVYALLSLAEGGDGFLVDYEEDTKALSRRALGCEAFWVKKGVGKSLL